MRSGRRQLPPPEQFTFADRYKIVLGAMALVLGVVLLYRVFTYPGGLSLPGVLVSLAFVGFGAYRLRTAWTRYREYRARDTGDE